MADLKLGLQLGYWGATPPNGLVASSSTPSDWDSIRCGPPKLTDPTH